MYNGIMGVVIEDNLFKKIRENSDNFRREYEEKAPKASQQTISDCITMMERGAYYMVNEIIEPVIKKRQEAFENKIKNMAKFCCAIFAVIPFFIEFIKIVAK